VIRYPADQATEAEADRHGIPYPVLIRDLVRIVEVLNLERQGFFGPQSVLAGSLALRCFNTPRFTVYDADFATTVEAKRGRSEMHDMLRYVDDDLEITPAELMPHDTGGTAWKSEPIAYLPAFTDLAPDGTREFKADISNRGLVLPGQEHQLHLPYDLGIWDEPPVVWIMDPHEITVEKVLGWVVHRAAKHYADLAFIALAGQPESGPLLRLDRTTLRNALAAKLEAMRGIQPDKYASFASLDDVVRALRADPVFSRDEWDRLVYLRPLRDRFNQATLKRAVQTLLVPLLLSEGD